MRLMLRWIVRIIAAGLILLLASLILGRFVPVPSTLMLARWATGKDVHRIWRPLEAMPRSLVEAVIASEDQRYCTHHGVDFIALNDVLSDEDGPSRGASTVTMQLAKNLYLWPGRSYLRKGLELPLALILDLAWGKARVMEVYLNIAEWGEGIFGAEAAAQHYYKKPASSLTAAGIGAIGFGVAEPVRAPRRSIERGFPPRSDANGGCSPTRGLHPPWSILTRPGDARPGYTDRLRSATSWTTEPATRPATGPSAGRAFRAHPRRSSSSNHAARCPCWVRG